jgi:hypothetical protein
VSRTELSTPGERARTDLLMSKTVVAADPNEPVSSCATDVPVETWTESWSRMTGSPPTLSVDVWFIVDFAKA